MMVLEHAVHALAPLAVTPQHMTELNAAIEEGTAALRDYLARRVARRLPTDSKPSLANAESEVSPTLPGTDLLTSFDSPTRHIRELREQAVEGPWQPPRAKG